MTHGPKTCDEAGKRAQVETERVRALAETMALDRHVAPKREESKKLRITKVGVTVRIGRNYDFQTVAYEQFEEAELDLTDDRDEVVAEMRDRAFRDVISATNKAYDKLKALKDAEIK